MSVLSVSSNTERNVISVPASAGTLSGVRLYPTSAEIRRQFTLDLEKGLNRAIISGLPKSIEANSICVEQRASGTLSGEVIVQDVKQGLVPFRPRDLIELRTKARNAAAECNRVKETRSALEKYLNTLSAASIELSSLPAIFDNYTVEAAKLDEHIERLSTQSEVLNAQVTILEQHQKSPELTELNQQVTIDVSVADEACALEVVLTYVVTDASWTPAYDIRVDTSTRDKPIALTYKAMITQKTGEQWNEVPVVLVTDRVSDHAMPSLPQWQLYIPRNSSKFPFTSGSTAFEEDREINRHVHCTYELPEITIPGNGSIYDATITTLALDATLTRVTTPKIDTRTHIEARVVNASQYSLLAGIANIFVDGDFKLKSHVPLADPNHTFDCYLGVDASIQITYHPPTFSIAPAQKKAVTSSHSQRISILNTGTADVSSLKVIDQIPTARDSISVKILQPILPISLLASMVVKASASLGINEESKSRDSAYADSKSSMINVEVTVPDEDVAAQWFRDPAQDHYAADGSELPVTDGKMNWLCRVPKHGKIDLVLKWEVTRGMNDKVSHLYGA